MPILLKGILTRNYGSQRTFGAFYDLFAHENSQPDQPSNLHEQPLADDPEDCGEIEDYDENDVGSATTESARRKGNSDNRYFLGNIFNFLRPTTLRPPQVYPVRPIGRPTKPPYWSGGFFDTNYYRPPAHQYPSDYVKPVHEDAQVIHATYRPGVVGGLLGHVVGVTQVRPTNRPPETTSKQNTKYINNVRFSMLSSQATTNSNRRPRDRKENEANRSVLGSFIDLFFK
ncbi:unnamed protein product, partial [Iphiclides podalirius]